jgi:hypothetical protein
MILILGWQIFFIAIHYYFFCVGPLYISLLCYQLFLWCIATGDSFVSAEGVRPSRCKFVADISSRFENLGYIFTIQLLLHLKYFKIGTTNICIRSIVLQHRERMEGRRQQMLTTNSRRTLSFCSPCSHGLWCAKKCMFLSSRLHFCFVKL